MNQQAPLDTTKKRSGEASTPGAASAILERSAFRLLTARAASVIEKRNTIPILSYARIEIGDGRVAMRATDLDIEIDMQVEAETEGTTQAMISAAELSFFASAAEGPVSIEINHGSGVVILKEGDLTVRLASLLPVEDYVELAQPETEDAVRWSMSQKDASRLFRLCRHCISTEETRYYLNGVFLTRKPDGDTLRTVATDGHRLACIDSAVPVPPLKGIIVPTKTVGLILGLLARGGNEPVSVIIDGLRMAVSVDGVTLRSKLIDGTYPDYTRVMPEPSDNLVAFLSAGAIRRMDKAFPPAVWFRSRACRFDFGSRTMSCTSADRGSVSMPFQGKTAEGYAVDNWGFNLGYLAKQSAVTPTFRISAAKAGDPAIVRGDDPDALFVLMPMRV